MDASMAARTASPESGATTRCRGCGQRNFPARRATAGKTAASKRGFPEPEWRKTSSAPQEFPCAARRLSRGAKQENLTRSTRSSDSKIAWRAGWQASSICSIRSEEHTSELQSRLHLVCRLLLEKKNTKKASSAYIIKSTNTV